MNEYQIPVDFKWGGAISANQAEGAYLTDGRGLSAVDILPEGKERAYAIFHPTEALKTTYSYYPSHEAIDFYHHFKEDIKMLAGMGLKCFRTSISWPRIFPNGDDTKPNDAGLRFYDELFEECARYGMDILVTMNHFDTPLALIKKYGGWSNRQVLDCYINYVRTICHRYAGKVKYWIPVNEINMLMHVPYLGAGMLADADVLTDTQKYQAAHHQLLACAMAAKIARNEDPQCQIGCMLAAGAVYPHSCKPDDVLAAMASEHESYFFIDVQVRGYYPSYAKALFREKHIDLKIQPEDEQLLAENTVDFIAFSYYSSRCVAAEDTGHKVEGNAFTGVSNPYLETSDWGWQLDAKGLRVTMHQLYDRYQKPLFIVENGLGAVDTLTEDQTIEDDYRIAYHRAHIEEMIKAMSEGVEMIGYLTWGVIDLVSSGSGEMKKRYGFIYVDKDNGGAGTLKRYPKKSYTWYRSVIESNGQHL